MKESQLTVNETEMETEIFSFQQTLARHELRLTRGETSTLQVNIGLNCDLTCRHCHLEAGPGRKEMMTRPVMEEVINCARRFAFKTIDVTGGSPELLPGIEYLVSSLAPLTPRLIVRSNLVALEGEKGAMLAGLYRELKVVVTASLPATNLAQTDAQRGGGVWEKSLAALKMLNGLGYGVEGSGLELNLVSNPSGAFLPPGQKQAEKKFRADLLRKEGISFSSLFTFANVPLGRFRAFLARSGNLDDYLARLADGFNPGTLAGLMCRTQLSVDWEGRLHDCDFNLALGLPHAGKARVIADLEELPAPGTPIPVGDHCYACTVGAGFTCGGSIVT